MNEFQFQSVIDILLKTIYDECLKKINSDHTNRDTPITVRQIEHSLRNVSDVVRSRMIAKCALALNAVKEP